MARHHRHAQAIQHARQPRLPVRHHQTPLVIQRPGHAARQRARGILQHQRRPGAQRVVVELRLLRQRMVARHDAAPVQRAHIAKGEASANRDRLGGADRHVDTSVGQRVPDAVKYLIADVQLHIGKVAIEVGHQLAAARQLHDAIDRDAELPAPAVRQLLTLSARGEHFFDNLAAFVHEMLASGGQRYVAMLPFEQRNRQPGFQLAHRIADGRGHAMQLLRGGAETAGARYGVYHFKRIFGPHAFSFQKFSQHSANINVSQRQAHPFTLCRV